MSKFNKHFLSVAAGLALLALFSISLAQSKDSDTVSVSKVDDAFVVSATFVIDACVDEIWKIFTDYEHLEQLNPAISEATLVRYEDQQAVVRTILHECFLIFCKDLILVEVVEEEVEEVAERQKLSLYSQIAPGEGSFSGGWAHWTFAGQGSTTFVTYEGEKTLNKWALPLVTARQVKGRIERSLRATVANAEQLAMVASVSGELDCCGDSCEVVPTTGVLE